MPGLTIDLNIYADEQALIEALKRGEKYACACMIKHHGGQRDAGILRQIMADTIDAEPLARRQYVSCADPETLQEQDGSVERALLSMAVYVGKTRLIDNVLIGN